VPSPRSAHRPTAAPGHERAPLAGRAGRQARGLRVVLASGGSAVALRQRIVPDASVRFFYSSAPGPDGELPELTTGVPLYLRPAPGGIGNRLVLGPVAPLPDALAVAARALGKALAARARAGPARPDSAHAIGRRCRRRPGCPKPTVKFLRQSVRACKKLYCKALSHPLPSRERSGSAPGAIRRRFACAQLSGFFTFFRQRIHCIPYGCI
jgi:hypothetical protein